MNNDQLVGYLRNFTAQRRKQMDRDLTLKEKELKERKENNARITAALRKEKPNVPVQKISRQVPAKGNGLYYIDFQIKRLVSFYRFANGRAGN
jgi:hypothetical protein